MIPRILFVLITAAGLLPLPAFADIYLYIDDQGVLTFTNVPTSDRYRLFLREIPEKEAPSSSRYDRIIKEAAEKHDLPFALVKSIIKVESNFNPRAVSKKGAMGLMQIMPTNPLFKSIKDPFDPRQNIMAGTAFLRRMLDRFSGSLSLALAAYNAGPQAVEKYGNIPPFPETEGYIKKVFAYYRIYTKKAS